MENELKKSTEETNSIKINETDLYNGSIYKIPLLKNFVNLARSFSITPFFFNNSCCDSNLEASKMSKFDISRFGLNLNNISVYQCDLLVISGTINNKFSSEILKIYSKMCEPKRVMAYGNCVINGGMYRIDNGYSQFININEILKVDVYVPGCPPEPENFIEGIIKLKEIIRKS